ncbi:phage tail protein [Paenibacillus sp. GCM10027626]|uniref:phage tail protein n=1 Tax=Paenibacillus sp. GCM10027626 TaxID=3273411 RepID=UPI0036323FB9
MIGSFGKLIFLASAKKIRTFDNFKRSTTARWALHDIHLHTPKSEFLGPGQTEISFTMRFDVRYLMNPRKELSSLMLMCDRGTVESLIIGGRPLSTNKWYIESVGETWDYFDGQGRLLVGGADVTMKEYA